MSYADGHAAQLEADYRLFREEFGLTSFRDGAWLARACPAPGAWVTWDPDDPQRRRAWDPAVARLVRAYTA